MYFSHIFLKVPFNYVLLSRLLYSAKGISATDILPVICLGSDVALNKSKFIIIIIIIIIIIWLSASRDNWCTVGGDGGCRIGEVRAGTTSPMPDHKGFKLQ